MASRYRWRQQLLGSLQGQLQLATYLVVFLGFTGASSVGLLIGQRNLLANDQQLARQSIALCDKAIRGLQDDPAQLEQELLFHSNANTSLCIEDNSGTLRGPAGSRWKIQRNGKCVSFSRFGRHRRYSLPQGKRTQGR